jgi:iron complex transport system substrate-binding protein
MKKYFKLLSFILAAFILASCGENDKKQETGALLTLTDDMNETVRFDSLPHRIISLAPNITEIIYALGSGDKLIANTAYCNFPEGAKTKTKVADILTVDFEKIISLKPDLILLPNQGETKGNYDKLKELGLKVFVTKYETFAEIDTSFMQIGKILGAQDKADSMLADWHKRLAALQALEKNEKPKEGIFLLSATPIIVAGKASFIHKITETAGMKNLAGDVNIGYPEFSREEILKRNPDYIIFPKNDFGTVEQIRDSYPEWKSLKAFKENNVLGVDPDLFMRPGPRYVEAVEALHSVLYKSGN